MINENLKMTIFGLGHIGLPTAALFGNNGFEVIGVARNKEKINMINEGKSPIIEPGLDDLVEKAVRNNKLYATDNGLESVKKSNIIVVIVPTPMDNYKRADLSAVKSTCEIISQGLERGMIVIIESTVPQGTCENIIIPILEKSGLKAGIDFDIVYTPERAIPNNTIHEMTHNARVLGGIDKKSTERAVSIYKTIMKGEVIAVRNLITAETIKLIENTFRDVNIALSNEIAILCEGIGVDAIEAINVANHHPRVNIHTPGPGVGGHCLAIDPYFLVQVAELNGLQAHIIQTARNINENMPYHVVKLIIDALNESKKTISGSTIGLLGVAYKGNVADARETPAKPLISTLKMQGAEIFAHDPFTPNNTINKLGAKSSDIDTVLNCDCVVLVTDHEEYKNISPEMIKKKILVCTRPILDPDKFITQNIIFKGVGRI